MDQEQCADSVEEEAKISLGSHSQGQCREELAEWTLPSIEPPRCEVPPFKLVVVGMIRRDGLNVSTLMVMQVMEQWVREGKKCRIRFRAQRHNPRALYIKTPQRSKH